MQEAIDAAKSTLMLAQNSAKSSSHHWPLSREYVMLRLSNTKEQDIVSMIESEGDIDRAMRGFYILERVF